jgi:hypothetical protein
MATNRLQAAWHALTRPSNAPALDEAAGRKDNPVAALQA